MLDSLVDLAVVPGKSRSLKGMKTGAECGKIDQRASIIQAVLWIQKFQNRFVAGHLPVILHLLTGIPDRRIEPVQDPEQSQEQIQPGVSVAEMLQLVEQHVPELI